VAVIAGADAAAGAEKAAATTAEALGVATAVPAVAAAGRTTTAAGMLGASEVTGAEALSVTGSVATGAGWGAETGSGALTAGAAESLPRATLGSVTGGVSSERWPPRVSGRDSPSGEVSGAAVPRAPRTVEAGSGSGSVSGAGETLSFVPGRPRAGPDCADERVFGVED
jgi:hypothetical protein